MESISAVEIGNTTNKSKREWNIVTNESYKHKLNKNKSEYLSNFKFYNKTEDSYPLGKHDLFKISAKKLLYTGIMEPTHLSNNDNKKSIDQSYISFRKCSENAMNGAYSYRPSFSNSTEVTENLSHDDDFNVKDEFFW